MTKNVGGIDKILRIVVGLVLIGYALVGPDTGYNVWGFIGIIPLVTGLVGWCPIYPLLGLSTCPTKKD